MKFVHEKSFVEWIEGYFNTSTSPQDELTLSEKEYWEDIPIVTIRLREKGYDLEIDVPGFDRDEITSRISKGRVQISTHKKEILKQA